MLKKSRASGLDFKTTRYPALPGLGSRLASRPSVPGIFAPIDSRLFPCEWPCCLEIPQEATIDT